jgi:hypothetical protein
MEAMPQIDLEPRRHSHFYEIKPLSRWWLSVPVAMVLLGAYLNGFWRAETWGLVFFGGMLFAAVLLCFPRYWLSKIND